MLVWLFLTFFIIFFLPQKAKKEKKDSSVCLRSSSSCFVSWWWAHSVRVREFCWGIDRCFTYDDDALLLWIEPSLPLCQQFKAACLTYTPLPLQHRIPVIVFLVYSNVEDFSNGIFNFLDKENKKMFTWKYKLSLSTTDKKLNVCSEIHFFFSLVFSFLFYKLEKITEVKYFDSIHCYGQVKWILLFFPFDPIFFFVFFVLLLSNNLEFGHRKFILISKLIFLFSLKPNWKYEKNFAKIALGIFEN